MLGFAWLAPRQIQTALSSGRLEQAVRLLNQPNLQKHKQREALGRRVGVAFVHRGYEQLRQKNIEAAWSDLMQAETLNAVETADLRQALRAQGLEAVRAQLERGEPQQAQQGLATLRERNVQDAETRTLEEVSRGWQLAREQATQGEFAQAFQVVQRLGKVPRALEQFREELKRNQERCAALSLKLQEAAEGSRWREVVTMAEQLLQVAPQHAEARRLRSRAWRALEPVTVAERHPDAAPAQPLEQNTLSPRYLLWIDGVGGFLVCLGSRVQLGQANPETEVEVPLTADISRQHATLVRDPEGWLLEAIRPVTVNGQKIERALLRANDRVTLGASCQVQFHQPVAVSSSARLDVVSGHRLPLALDAVLLMGDTLVLGPGAQAHVSLPELRQPIVLFRQKDGLGVRHAGPLEIDGQVVRDRAQLPAASRVSGEDFAFAVEKVGGRLK